MNNIKNIVIVNDFDYIQGGASKVAIQTANMLVDAGYNVFFFSGVSTDTHDIDDRVTRISCNQHESLKDKNRIRGFINGIYNKKAYVTFKRLLNSLNKEETVVHVHAWTKVLSSSIFKASFKSGFKTILTMHDYFTACPNGGYFNYKRNEICKLKPMSFKCCTRNCDSRNYLFKTYRLIRHFVQNRIVKLNDRLTDVIAISDFSERILRKTLNQYTRVHKVLNPIDLDNNAEIVNYKDNKYYLYVGRVSPEKGVVVFCKAITELGVRGIVVGDGPELDKLKQTYPSIEYVGWQNSNQVKEYMKGAKALVFPSKIYEVAPLTTFEIMQYGIPVITDSSNAASDYINKDSIYNTYSELIDILKNESYSVSHFDFSKLDYVKDLVVTYNSL